MTSQTVLLCVLALASFFSSALCSPMCNNRCCRFVEGFPVRLKKLRQDYSRIRDFYVSKSTFSAGIFAASPAFPTAGMLHFLTSACQPLWVHGCLTAHLLFFSPSLFLQEANDDLDSALLDQSVEDSFKSPFACYAMNSLLEFYLDTVLPTAMAGVTEDTKNLKPHVESIQEIFNTLKRDVTQCRNYFSCKKHFDINNLNSTYTQMESRGLYKAMGELDILFNYFETYLASKRHRQ
ncbi:interleukin-10 isoform X1 [Astatotilapia calliptera]|uniref:Interleukin family protein n=1 Tax=Astatotilapia calliptera TaxID=8154 RepID=A0AAX7TNY5_ASTCA|nr:interleukin-10 isoform X1 [Maylandia zebra]XP_026022215.1 interleukin-10 isoform X1 [Astatotilapia calliptera]